MPAQKVRPYTEDELYVVPQKASAETESSELKAVTPSESKLVSFPPFVNPLLAEPSFWKKNQTAIVIAGILLAVGVGVYIYRYNQKKNKDKENEAQLPVQ